MRNRTPISRGDFWATVFLLFLILLGAAFLIFYRNVSPRKVDLSDFQTVVNDFYAQQAFLADSAAQARAARDSAYRQRWTHSKYRYRYARSGWHPYAHHSDSTFRGRDTFSFVSSSRPRLYRIQKVDLNDCDTADIVRVPRFGSKRARKIVEYRDRLGGFYSLEQLREIYILQNIDLDFCEKYFTINPHKIRKIAVNQASYKELTAHPYMDAYLAKSILAYRSKHGRIANIQELQHATHAYPELIDKLKPYLIF